MTREFNEKIDKIAEENFPTGIPFSTPYEDQGNVFIDKAVRLVDEEIRSHSEGKDVEPFVVYIVWFAKTLQNWKALLSTDIPDGRYYEVTYNGDKQEAYVDTYVKVLNTRRPDAVSLPHTQEENIQFRKDWDRRVDEAANPAPDDYTVDRDDPQTPDLVGRD